MKKTALLLAVLTLFAGCAQDNRTVDERYIDSLKQALSSRWKADPTTSVFGNFEAPVDETTFKKAIDDEISLLDPYEEETFENEELKKLADSYLESLRNIKDASKYYTADQTRFYNQYSTLMDNNAITLSEIDSISPLEFSSDDDKVRMEMVLEDADVLKSVKEIVSNIDFETVQEDDYPDSYFAELQASVENTSDFTFDGFYLDVSFLDENGAIVDQRTAEVPLWKPGQVQKLDIYTGHKYSKIEISGVSVTVPQINYFANIDLSKLE